MEYNHTLTSRGKRALVERDSTAKFLLLLAALVSFVLSVSLWFSAHELQGIFVGLWVPSILALGSIVLPRGEGR
jgi:hypothetical protein